MGPDPGPVYISPELISGGRAAKSSIYERRPIAAGRTGLARSGDVPWRRPVVHMAAILHTFLLMWLTNYNSEYHETRG
jgi:hypothetical protein